MTKEEAISVPSMRAWKRWAAVVSLLLLSPLVAEYLSGSMPMSQLAVLPILVLIYGAGSVLIREVVRRTGRGFAAILLLGLAYGVIEEGILDLTLFNPHFHGLHLLDYGFVPALGLALPWTLYVLTIHVVWSIAVPIVLVEALFGGSKQPWLRLPGLGVMAVLYLAGGWAVFVYTAKEQHFMATPVQLGGAAIAAALCIGLAFLTRRASPAVSGKAIPPVLLGGSTLLLTSAFVVLYGQSANVLHLPWVLAAGGMVLLIAAMLLSAFYAGRAASGKPMTGVAMAGGALLTYCWLGFSTETALHSAATLLPHAVLAGAMIALLVLALWNAHRAGQTTTPPSR